MADPRTEADAPLEYPPPPPGVDKKEWEAQRKAAAERMSAPIEIDYVIPADGQSIRWLDDTLSEKKKIQILTAGARVAAMRAWYDFPEMRESGPTDPIWWVEDWEVKWGDGVDDEIKMDALEIVALSWPSELGAHIGPNSFGLKEDEKG